MTLQIGYCTNVHAGPDLAQTKANLETYALDVKRRFSPDATMGLGLWLASPAATQMLNDKAVAAWADWLGEVGLVPFTLNGFPYGDFHRDVVKHRVYEPTWLDSARWEYTTNLIAILHGILPEGLEGSISTLPIAWGEPALAKEQLDRAAKQLRDLAWHLYQYEDTYGRLITVCLEPEPGCVIQRSEDVVRFFEEHLLRGESDEETLRRYIRVCHDVCHQVVMFESQSEVLDHYRRAGIAVGKVQVSSAVCMPLAEMEPDDHAKALAQLGTFREERYLHQTVVKTDADAEPIFFEDLPLALSDPSNASPTSDWRVHFHVPVYLEKFGHLRASREAILECLQSLDVPTGCSHLEVETYAWGVLPSELQQPDLATGIAEEMTWLRDVLASSNGLHER